MLAVAQAPSYSASASLDYSAFKVAVLNACKVVEKRNTIPILNMMLMIGVRGGVRVIGTDLDLYTTTFIPGQADADFVALVDAHKLKGVMDKVKDAAQVLLVQHDEHLEVAIGKVKLNLKQEMPRADFPEEATFRDKLKTSNASFTIASSLLAKILQKVKLAISTEETRYYLNGVFMHVNEPKECLTFVSTDGHKLARYEIPVPPGAEAAPDGVIIPRKTIDELYRMVTRKGCPERTQITVTETGVSFQIGENELLETKTVDGTFPDYQRVIPSWNDKKVAMRTEGLITALKQASAIMTERSKGAKFTFSHNKVVITCSDPDFGAASTDVLAFHDVELEIGMNANYLTSILGQLDGGSMFEMNEAGDPVIIKDGADEGVTYVLMPLRV